MLCFKSAFTGAACRWGDLGKRGLCKGRTGGVMWKLRGLDRQLFEGVEARIFEFLDVAPLMPPARLRFSKLLGRPLMEPVECHCVATVSLDEVRDTEWEVHGQTGNEIRFAIGEAWPRPYLDVWCGLARDAPADLVGVCLVSNEDWTFGAGWQARHGACWPAQALDDFEIDHPAIEPLVRRYHEWQREWREQLDERLAAATVNRHAYWRSSTATCPCCRAWLLL